ncbi:outer membrane protein transport protein [Limnohabitans sp.]|uniref:OmpP1/FadL family transporter n=1 Tax=Limnohabitans sp. TaxID=1907725 RepID=UPI00261B1BE2|nr:outer membrane protein transport protein [Limnohabitans sp.]
MKTTHTLRATVAASALLLASLSAHATNGMLMEGYGPQSLAMGGAATAFDNGTAAMMNNPATLQLGANGSRLDVALGVLGPNVKSSMTGMPTASSSGTSYVMPAMGWVRKDDRMTWGVGVFGQGGMGTEYGADTFLAMQSGKDVRSELAVGRVIFPVALKVNEQLNIGASLDYSWASLDMKMAASGAQLGGMVTGGSGNIAAAAAGLAAAPWARIDFSNSNKFTGAAKGSGWTGKLGLVFQANKDLSLGLSHHLKTNLSDMTTTAAGASMSGPGGFADAGKISVINFQMPASTTVGLAWQASPKLLVAADVKRLGWSSVMKGFSMRYDSATMGGNVNFTMPQNWKDQTVVALGGAYQLDDVWTLRAGYNHASNPIPDGTVNPLFPAIVKNHYTAGFGYKLSKSVSVDAAMSHAPTVTVVNTSGQMPLTISHSQTNYQMLLSYRY